MSLTSIELQDSQCYTEKNKNKKTVSGKNQKTLQPWLDFCCFGLLLFYLGRGVLVLLSLFSLCVVLFGRGSLFA